MGAKTVGALLVVVLVSAEAHAQATVFLVRHAERADTAAGAPATMGTDPSLSQQGRARAETLARVLRDSKVSTIFVTEYKRTQETAAPLAAAAGLTPVAVPARETAALIARLQALGAPALVVGHSNTVPEIIKALGVTADLTIDDAEYDNLFIVTPSRQLVHLRLP